MEAMLNMNQLQMIDDACGSEELWNQQRGLEKCFNLSSEAESPRQRSGRGPGLLSHYHPTVSDLPSTQADFYLLSFYQQKTPASEELSKSAFSELY